MAKGREYGCDARSYGGARKVVGGAAAFATLAWLTIPGIAIAAPTGQQDSGTQARCEHKTDIGGGQVYVGSSCAADVNIPGIDRAWASQTVTDIIASAIRAVDRPS